MEEPKDNGRKKDAPSICGPVSPQTHIHLEPQSRAVTGNRCN